MKHCWDRGVIFPASYGFTFTMSIDFRQLAEQLERISSRRIALRPVVLADGWPLFEATRNPLFNQHLLWEQPEKDTEVLQRMDAIVDAARNGRMAALSAVVKKTGEWMSLFRFQPYAGDPMAMEMGIWTHDRFWQGRFSIELCLLCVDAAFLTSDVEFLIGATTPENRSSCRLMEFSGMKPTKRLHRWTEKGEALELQEYAVTRAEWRVLRPNAEASFQLFPYAVLPSTQPGLAAATLPRLSALHRLEELQAA